MDSDFHPLILSPLKRFPITTQYNLSPLPLVPDASAIHILTSTILAKMRTAGQGFYYLYLNKYWMYDDCWQNHVTKFPNYYLPMYRMPWIYSTMTVSMKLCLFLQVELPRQNFSSNCVACPLNLASLVETGAGLNIINKDLSPKNWKSPLNRSSLLIFELQTAISFVSNALRLFSHALVTYANALGLTWSKIWL